ncbi:CD0415/CD1112 family protein [Streptococcus equi subsp. equi]|uniref:VirB6/TrbL-like conjugal transfer protein, CD1112 family n=1 Tax=Streptococcus equi TaxID=1336 RepID=UPI00294B0F74|nr:CD0415/CD1112 family protein [Streptococcus equi]WOK44946.1 CD0415/CD1112 family protein [Streptococcus equi subsp. equi]WOK46818.1 CD0415/CD1112 family protein [Streptococcus equi subsp. equi]WOK48721.1 CD0415/CD1112 family protein [Streptococcus equi subsp. equi]
MFDLFGKIEEFFKDIMIDIIKDNLSAMLVDINDKVGTVAGEVGKTPSSWNSEVFTFIKSINTNVVLPIAAIILTAILCIELIQVVMRKNSMHDTDTFEFFKYIIKMWIAVWLVSHAFDFSMAVFDVAQSMIGKAAGVVGTSANITPGNFDAMVEALKTKELGTLIGIALETGLVKFSLTILSILITVILYGRMIDIYIYCSVAAIPFSTMGNKEWSNIGTNYIKSLFALGLQGLFILIFFGIYAVLVKTVNFTDIHTSILQVLAYGLILGVMMMKSGSIAKAILNSH